MTELEQRIAALRVGREFAAYERVRREVLRLLALDDADMPGDGAPSEYWREELAGFEYLFDASPLLIEKLRHHSYHVTGLKVYDYRSHKVAAKARFVEKLGRSSRPPASASCSSPSPRCSEASATRSAASCSTSTR